MILAQFSHFWWLGIVVFVIGILAWYFVKRYTNKQQMPFFFNNQNVKPTNYIVATKAVLFVVGLCFLLVAVWQPQWGQDLQKTQKKGLDIIFTVDVSKSMNALDFSQGREYMSRLDATKFLISRFAKKLASDRIGLVEFAGESFVASPLTLDHTIFLNFLQNISSDDLGKQGTNLAEAIEVSIARLEVQSENEQNGSAIVLFSDGDETITSDAKKMAEMARDKGIKIYTIGVGSEDGSPIPEGQDAFGDIKYKKYQGKTVMTALDPESLKEISKITGGEYFHVEGASDLKNLSKKLSELPTKIIDEENVTPKKERYLGFALVGMILFMLGFVLPEYPLVKLKIKK